MNSLGTKHRPLRVAIVGSGPSGFYAAEALLKSPHTVTVDMFERLPVPYGLVRYGVAPDHPKIKNVIRVYEKTVELDGFSFFGNVTVGKDIAVHELKKFYDAIVFAYGAETDRPLNIPGENLPGSHTATEFVAWYNGRPEYRDRQFDLSCERAVVIGQGNVAVDVCRILCKTVDELKNTDICQHALEVLAESKVKEVHMIGRRGPAQAAFTPVEIREFGQLADCAPVVEPKDLELNEASRLELENPKNAPKKKNYEILQQLSTMSQEGKSRRFFVHFFKGPKELVGTGRVEKVILERNELAGEAGKQNAKGMGITEELDCGIFFRSVGYRGLPIPGVPFREDWAVIPNVEGRVTKAAGSQNFVPGLYCTGWIKRGPSGVIGTNKADADKTVGHLWEDLSRIPACENSDSNAVRELLRNKGVRFVTFDDWKKIDAAEVARGQPLAKPREKFVSVEEMLNLGTAP